MRHSGAWRQSVAVGPAAGPWSSADARVLLGRLGAAAATARRNSASATPFGAASQDMATSPAGPLAKRQKRLSLTRWPMHVNTAPTSGASQAMCTSRPMMDRLSPSGSMRTSASRAVKRPRTPTDGTLTSRTTVTSENQGGHPADAHPSRRFGRQESRSSFRALARSGLFP